MRIEDATPGTKPRSAPSPALPPLVVKGKKLTVPVVQGGMGVGVSLHPLAGAVAREGGLGVVSSAAIDRVVSKRLGRKVGTYEAVREEIAASKSQGGLAGINIMVALQRDFADPVRGAIDAGADAIISGAGLPTSLPAIQDPGDRDTPAEVRESLAVQPGQTVVDATRRLKESALKICYHMMPGLPGSTPERDLEGFRTIFEDSRFKPDMLKIYPTLVVKGTRLYDWWKRGEYTPLTTEDAAELVSKVMEITPPWARIMRVQRDIPLPRSRNRYL